MPVRFASVATGRRAALATVLTLVACATVQRTSITDDVRRIECTTGRPIGIFKRPGILSGE